mmetsp:Transcript_9348/g.14352  ORF Transcript_9348/g.14352 Transcript_9348/m.14352 type:complete len:210 (-) Transcript_9348:725-1354(-)
MFMAGCVAAACQLGATKLLEYSAVSLGNMRVRKYSALSSCRDSTCAIAPKMFLRSSGNSVIKSSVWAAVPARQTRVACSGPRSTRSNANPFSMVPNGNHCRSRSEEEEEGPPSSPCPPSSSSPSSSSLLSSPASGSSEAWTAASMPMVFSTAPTVCTPHSAVQTTLLCLCLTRRPPPTRGPDSSTTTRWPRRDNRAAVYRPSKSDPITM